MTPAHGSPPRLVSVDALRGCTVAAMLLVNTPGDWSHVFPPLLHAAWHGFTPTDLVFPLFLFIVGVSIALGPLALPGQATPARARAVWSRAGRLVALGLLLHLCAWLATGAEAFRPMGVLQRIGLCYLAVALLAMHAGARAQGVLFWALLVGYGGVLALAADDHACRSSTLPHGSEHEFVSALMPVLNPAGVQDILDMGLLGWAMSRYTGRWVGFKTIAETVESSASVNVNPHQLDIVVPTDFELPPGGLNIRWPDPPLDQEMRLHQYAMQAAQAFARANHIDKVVMDSPKARLGIVTTGKSYLDVLQALEYLGIDAEYDSEGTRVLGVTPASAQPCAACSNAVRLATAARPCAGTSGSAATP